jgi:hypothetical protein
MTALVCWFNRETPDKPTSWMVADSRLSRPSAAGGCSPLTDYGAKVLTLHCEFRNPPMSNPAVHRPIATLNLGFGYCGSSLIALQTYAVAANLLDQIAVEKPPGSASLRPWLGLPLRFDDIASYIAEIFRGYVLNVGHLFPNDAKASLVIAGPCPTTGELCFAEVFQDHENPARVCMAMYRYTSTDPAFALTLGSGANEVERITGIQRTIVPADSSGWWQAPLFAVRKLIQDQSDGTVGGIPQIGIADEYGFAIQGVSFKSQSGRRFQLLGVNLATNLSNECVIGARGLMLE